MLRSHHSTTSVPSGVSLQRVRSIPLSWSKPTGKRFCSGKRPDWWNFWIILLTNQQSNQQRKFPATTSQSTNKPSPCGLRCEHGLLCWGNKQHYILNHDSRPSLYLRHLIEVLSEAAGRPEAQDSTDKHRQRQSQEVSVFTNTECVETGFLFCPTSQSKGHRWALKS